MEFVGASGHVATLVAGVLFLAIGLGVVRWRKRRER